MKESYKYANLRYYVTHGNTSEVKYIINELDDIPHDVKLILIEASIYIKAYMHILSEVKSRLNDVLVYARNDDLTLERFLHEYGREYGFKIMKW